MKTKRSLWEMRFFVSLILIELTVRESPQSRSLADGIDLITVREVEEKSKRFTRKCRLSRNYLLQSMCAQLGNKYKLCFSTFYNLWVEIYLICFHFYESEKLDFLMAPARKEFYKM